MPRLERVAFISDVHSNLEALEAVLGQLRTEKVFCLGDVVGYGPDPNKVIETLRDHNATILLGNHDDAVVTGDTGYFNARAALAVMWTRRKTSESNLEFLASLPKTLETEISGVRVYMTHGSPDDPLGEYVDPSTHSYLFPHYLRKLNCDALALGHTHLPFVWKGPEGTVFNPGSVGQPRDGDWRASYAIGTFDSGAVTVEPHRVEYEWERTAEKIRAAGLPEALAGRLGIGR